MRKMELSFGSTSVGVIQKLTKTKRTRLLLAGLSLILASCAPDTAVRNKPVILIPFQQDGCLNQDATNFSNLSTDEDGSCDFSYCSDSSYADYDPGFYQNRIAPYLEFLTQNNISYRGDINSNACFKTYGCLYEGALNQDKTASAENGSCQFSYCNDPNYADTNPEYLQKVIQPYLEKLEEENLPFTGTINTNACFQKMGCMQVLASNTDPDAIVENGTCLFEGCDDPNYIEYDSSLVKAFTDYKAKYSSATFTRLNCSTPLYGCKQILAKNYDGVAVNENGTCQFEACLQEKYENYNKTTADSIQAYLNELNQNSIAFTGSINGNQNCGKKIVGCTIAEATNHEIDAKTEDGSCRFQACLDSGYVEYNPALAQVISNYQTNYPNAPITNSCSTAYVCNHPDATNYSPGNGFERCQFIACDRPQHDNYQKFVEYQEYIANHSGGITLQYDFATCGAFNSSLPVNTRDKGHEKVTIDMIIDNSTSMDKEIQQVQGAMDEVTQIFQDVDIPVDIRLFDLSNVSKTKEQFKQDGFFFHRYLAPEPVAVAQIETGDDDDLEDAQETIDQALEEILVKTGSGIELGVCHFARLTKDYVESNRKEANIQLLLTDEDDERQAKLTSCHLTHNINGPLKSTVFPTKNPGGDLRDSVIEMIVDSGKQKDMAFVFLMVDKNNNQCVEVNEDGTIYRELKERLKDNGIGAIQGDVCAPDYNELLNDTLIKQFFEIIGLRYVYSTNGPQDILGVTLVKKNGKTYDVKPEEYTLGVENGEAFILFKSSFRKKLRKYEEIRLKTNPF